MIPNFDHNGVIPPHLGSPQEGGHQMSPYPTTSLEFCEKFATSPERIDILKRFLEFRSEMRKSGISGFQWLDGSFVEDIENSSRNRPPQDLDILTFYYPITVAQNTNILANFIEFVDRKACKTKFKLDHLMINIGVNPVIIIEFTRYFLQLFTHNRDQVWKGMLKMEVGITDEDADAEKYLNSLL
jgi:hypothetical protein